MDATSNTPSNADATLVDTLALAETFTPKAETLHTNIRRHRMIQRRVSAFRRAQINRVRARNAAKRLRYQIETENVTDPSILGIFRNLYAQGQTKVVGPRYADGRKLTTRSH
jgi:hypothetical protein